MDRCRSIVTVCVCVEVAMSQKRMAMTARGRCGFATTATTNGRAGECGTAVAVRRRPRRCKWGKDAKIRGPSSRVINGSSPADCQRLGNFQRAAVSTGTVANATPSMARCFL